MSAGTTVWLTVAEAAEHVRAKDERIIRQAIKSGDLPAYAYGEVQIRLKAGEVDAWLEARPFEPRDAS
jgi:excisionase family DNA binding protein